MLAEQARHIYDVLLCVQQDTEVNPVRFEPHIVESWRRCVFKHGLNPEKLNEALIVPHSRLIEHQDAISDLTALARHGLHALWRQLRDMDYVVLLADSAGVVVERYGSDAELDTFKRSGLHLGALWNEPENGTSAVGMVLATGKSATVHRGDHFDATHIGLTCSAAPVYDSQNRLCAVLDVSSIRPKHARQSQYWAARLVRQFAVLVEHAALIRAHQNDWLVRIGYSPVFLDVSPEYLLAVDQAGNISGASHAFHTWAAKHLQQPQLIGCAFETLFGANLISVYSRQDSAPLVDIDGIQLFAHVNPPAAKSGSTATRTDTADTELAPELAKLCGSGSSQRQMLQRLSVLADTQVPILINGETGTGKEWLARAVHLSGSRSDRPFIAVNCAAIPENLIESELYGYEPHSFTGACSKGKPGLIRAADGGTLFLDEIGDMPLFLQSRLLRVLSEREVTPVGSVRARKVDVRIICATHHDLQERIAAGKFREDLYYRLNGIQTTLPPLRERDDIDYVVQSVLDYTAEKAGLPLKPLSADALHTLRNFPWPGNLRQLAAALEVALCSAQGGSIEAADLPEYLRPACEADAERPLAAWGKHTLADEADLRRALADFEGNVTRFARAIGVSRMTVYRYLKKYGIEY